MKRVFSEEDAKALVSTTRWLRNFGLRTQKLDIQQILPNIGFRHRRDRVPSLKKEVSAVHSVGLFPVYKDSDGSIYNICAGEARLTGIECRLANLITLYRHRLEWLTTRSQHVFGVVEESSVAVVIDRPDTTDTTWEKLKNDMVLWSEEQLSRITRVNMFWCGSSDINQWHSEATPITSLSINSLTDWLRDQISTSSSLASESIPYDKTAVLEAVLMAMADKKVESVYFITNGKFLTSGEETFRRKVTSMQVQLHVVSYRCDNESQLTRLKDIATITGGKFHVYPSVQPNHLLSRLSNEAKFPTLHNSLLSTSHVSLQESRTSSDSFSYSPQPHALSNEQSNSRTTEVVCEDVQLLFDELQRALDNMAEIRTLHHEIAGQRKPILTDEEMRSRGTESEEKPEETMSSREWLMKHSLKTKGLRFYDLISTISFRHCEAVIDIKAPKNISQSNSELVSHYKLVGAKYCGRFAHIRWVDGSLRHVFLSHFAYEQQKIKLISLLELYKTRLAWLKRGSRELFGTIVEDQVIILIDISSSMENHLEIVKDKFEYLLKEQLKFKSKFNVIRFGSTVAAWRDRLTDITPQTVHQLMQWVNGLVAEGSTNVGDAIQLAMADRDVQAIYLLTDGRPDQPTESILSRIQQVPLIPIHTIAFNCDDSEANRFLTKLAALTGGRYHYYSDDTRPHMEATRPSESEDCRLLREEIKQAEHDLKQMDELRAECSVLETKALSRRDSQERLRLSGATVSAGTRSRSQSSFSKAAKLQHLSSQDSQLDVHSDFVSKQRLTPKKLPPLSLSSKKWLRKNGLLAKHLTILHALEPVLIKHKPEYIPILNKNVVAQVFDELLPISHVSSNSKGIHLVNPQAVDLAGYEESLGKAIALYERRLDQLVWNAIPDETKRHLNLSGDPPSFSANRDKLLECLDNLGWPVSKQDVDVLEKEINKGHVFMQQSRDLRSTVKSSGLSTNVRVRSECDDEKETVGIDQRDLNEELKIKRATKLLERYKGHQLIARDGITGLYFRAKAINPVDAHHLEMEFSNNQCQVVSVKHIFDIGGSRPCPVLKPGQFVLCETTGPLDSDSDDQWNVYHYYVPAIVLASPSKMLDLYHYTVVDCFKSKIVAPRRQLLLISRTQFTFAVRYISQCQSPTIATDLFPSSETPTNDDVTSNTNVEFLIDSATQTVNETATSGIQTDIIEAADDQSMSHDLSINQQTSQSSIQTDAQQTEGQELITTADLVDDPKLADVVIPTDYTSQPHSPTDNKHSSDGQNLMDTLTPTTSEAIKVSTQTVHIDDKSPTIESDTDKDLTKLRDLILRLHRKQGGQLKKKLINMSRMIIQVQRRTQGVYTVSQQKAKFRKMLRAQERVFAALRNDLQQMCEEQQLVRLEAEKIRDKNKELSVTVEHLHQLLKEILDRPVSAEFDAQLDSVEEQQQDNGMVLVASGDQGYVVSSQPLQYPVIEPVEQFPEDPMEIKLNAEVLARWPEDGWYYRAIVTHDYDDGTYLIDDGSYEARLSRCDLITDKQDGKIISDDDRVVALHPLYSDSFAPGIAKDASQADWSLHIEFYDGNQATLNREDVYWLDAEKYQQDVAMIEEHENSWIGKIVVARNNTDGLYYHAEVKEKIAGGRMYKIEWNFSDDDKMLSQVLDLRHLFGSLTQVRPLKMGDRVLTTYNQGQTFVAGWVAARPSESSDHVTINFCDGMRSTDIDESSCFWLSQEYYDEAVEYYRSKH